MDQLDCSGDTNSCTMPYICVSLVQLSLGSGISYGTLHITLLPPDQRFVQLRNYNNYYDLPC